MARVIDPEAGSRQTPDVETWQNAGRARVVLKMYNQRGELADHMITGGRTFTITPKERRLNQELAANRDLDHFANGMLAPVRLIETEEDTAEIAANPNLIAESEMADLFTVHPKTFEKRINDITNPVTLTRLLEVAKEVDAKTSRVEAVKERLVAISPSLYTEVTSTDSGPPSEMRAQTPR